MRRDSSPSTLLAAFRDDVGALGFSPGGRTQSAVRTEGTTRNNVYVQPEVSIEPSSGSGISLSVRSAHVTNISSVRLGFLSPRKKCSKGSPEETATANVIGGGYVDAVSALCQHIGQFTLKGLAIFWTTLDRENGSSEVRNAVRCVVSGEFGGGRYVQNVHCNVSCCCFRGFGTGIPSCSTCACT